MSRRLNDQQRQALLQNLIDLCHKGQAESESEDPETFLKTFVPIRAHFRVLDPDVRLIIGIKVLGRRIYFAPCRMTKVGMLS